MSIKSCIKIKITNSSSRVRCSSKHLVTEVGYEPTPRRDWRLKIFFILILSLAESH